MNKWKYKYALMLSRIRGKAYPRYDTDEIHREHGKNSAHIEAEWTTPCHWAHNNYERTHLPQLCIRASGWKAKLLALFLWPKPPI